MSKFPSSISHDTSAPSNSSPLSYTLLRKSMMFELDSGEGCRFQAPRACICPVASFMVPTLTLVSRVGGLIMVLQYESSARNTSTGTSISLS